MTVVNNLLFSAIKRISITNDSRHFVDIDGFHIKDYISSLLFQDEDFLETRKVLSGGCGLCPVFFVNWRMLHILRVVH